MERPSGLREELSREIDREVGEVLSRARREGEALLREARLRGEEERREASERLESEVAARRRRALARAELEGENALRRLRKEEMDRVFALAGERLERMDAEDPEGYARLLEHLYRSCRPSLPPGEARVRVGAGGRDLSRRLSGEGDRWEVEEGLAGIVLESPDGRLRCDATFPVLLQNLRRDRGAEIEKLLFGDTSHGRE